ncbi:MAG: hypothetical protein KZQ60_06105 [Candidatus Thiodiazotropha sp. (ex Lucinoma aequizonata)]|nr:hypothetical protein [Candidatus Thiodiazotropha sp. (ex Lucinoma aequizonata)]
MPFISPFRSPFRPYNHAYAYRGLTPLRPAFHGAQRVHIYEQPQQGDKLA